MPSSPRLRLAPALALSIASLVLPSPVLAELDEGFELTLIGTLDEPAYLTAVSEDGRIAAGSSYDAASGVYRPARFVDGEVEFLPATVSYTYPYSYAYPSAISADGAVVGGWGELDSVSTVFLWGPGDEVETWPGSFRGLSRDGRVVVGRQSLWRDGEPVALPDIGALDGVQSWELWDVSPDGEFVVGWMRLDGNQTEGFRWSESLGLETYGSVRLEAVADRGLYSVGSVRVGSNSVGGFRFGGPLEVPVPIGDVAIEELGIAVRANASVVSDGGAVVAGQGNGWTEGFLWDEERGTRVLDDILEQEYGLDSWEFRSAQPSDIAAGGRIIAGTVNRTGSYAPVGFIARMPCSATACDPEPPALACGLGFEFAGVAAGLAWWRGRRARHRTRVPSSAT